METPEVALLQAVNNAVALLRPHWRANRMRFLRRYTELLFADSLAALGEDCLTLSEFEGVLLSTVLLLEQHRQQVEMPAAEDAKIITGLKFVNE